MLTDAVELSFTHSSGLTIRRRGFVLDPAMVTPGKTMFTLDDVALQIEQVEVRGTCTVIVLAGWAPENIVEFESGEGGFVTAMLHNGNMLEVDLGNARIAEWRDPELGGEDQP